MAEHRYFLSEVSSPGVDPPTSEVTPPDWIARRYKPYRPADPRPFPGSTARVFLRRQIGMAAIEEVRAFLTARASGRWAIVPDAGWTAVDIVADADLALLRETFAHRIDGWQIFTKTM